ncbi:glutathione S-transferase domain-containing protein [Myxococcus landrumensis]|uniref:Glutathione S-transferase domain-containing protein n=1 Tax=Myxococcus landrumensis TaxID=2813577 RepID=A0ABX7N915_9BACT|nr:glutathione S-transferase domain-containing protein [Myxococcus landrumus]QSQ15266.1 glutathione S-transferase domain-containing protein [Myxococcus landrumus]
MKPIIIGRSSSHFTRIARVFAEELRVDYDFHILRDLMSPKPEDYGGNPALKIPVLRDSRGSWFGALNVCRELWRRSSHQPSVVWPEDLTEPVSANAQELVLQSMATEVTLIMSRVGGGAESSAHQDKMRRSLGNMLGWLDENAASVFNALPAGREVSFLEVSLYCLVMHLEFREVLPTAPFTALTEFCQRFGTRASCAATVFRFDT